ncbi:right-handed parallel beta-helix repeat-containing protein [Candidatus Woesearchaeota archaeon]|nr:right-handed parallel beta-helix repeat-containing protein [Candidatus Woesearchaeota archaeon]
MPSQRFAMMKLVALLAAFLLVPFAYAGCIVPSSNLEIKNDSAFCPGSYALDQGIVIGGNGITLDCSGASLTGEGIGYGILLKNRINARIQNCSISSFEIGIYLDGTNNSIISNNHLANNKFGIALYSSFGNDLYDNILSGNAENSISYFPAPIEKEGKAEEEKKSTPTEIMKEIIKVKKPLLSEKEVVKEVDMIFSKHFNFTEENLEIRREISYNESDGSTSITIHLKPKKALLNVSVYEKIPKCVSEYANQIFFEAPGYEVIENDPLILWTFARMENEEEISYKVFKRIGNECKELLLAFGIAAGFEKEAAKKPNEKTGYFMIPVIAFILLIALFLIRRKRPS